MFDFRFWFRLLFLLTMLCDAPSCFGGFVFLWVVLVGVLSSVGVGCCICVMLVGVRLSRASVCVMLCVSGCCVALLCFCDVCDVCVCVIRVCIWLLFFCLLG